LTDQAPAPRRDLIRGALEIDPASRDPLFCNCSRMRYGSASSANLRVKPMKQQRVSQAFFALALRS